MITDKHFKDWESHAFGYGYGTGEAHTLRALYTFVGLCKTDPPAMYNYEVLEKILGETVTWLMINFMAHQGLIEYGTSPRYGWLTDRGRLIQEYMSAKSPQELYDLVADGPDDYIHCLKDHCNCDGKPCANPLFV